MLGNQTSADLQDEPRLCLDKLHDVNAWMSETGLELLDCLLEQTRQVSHRLWIKRIDPQKIGGPKIEDRALPLEQLMR